MSQNKSEKSGFNPKGPFYWMSFLLTILGIISVITLLWSNNLANRLIYYDFPIDDATMELELEIANYHLWLEEYLSGDRTIKIETVKHHIIRAVNLCKALLEGGDKDEHGFPIKPLKSKETKKIARQILALLKQFEALSYKRIKYRTQAGAGSGFDQKHDQLYLKISAKVKTLRSLIIQDLTVNFSYYQFFFKIILVFLILIISVVVAGFLRMEKRLRKSDRELRIRNRILEIFLSVPGDEMYTELIQLVREASESKYVFLGYIDLDDDSLIIPSLTRDIWDQCQVPDKTLVFPRNKLSPKWRGALREKTSLCFNDGPFQVPPGHIPITRAMLVPVIHLDDSVGLIVAANRETDYKEKDLALLETIARHMAPVFRVKLEKDRQDKKRREAEEKLKKSREELRNLSTHLQSAIEKERIAIAREVHDELGQLLTALQIEMSELIMELPQEDKARIEKTKSMAGLIRTSIQTVQKISSSLRPSLLDNLGIIPALEWQSEEFQNRLGIECEFFYNKEDIILDKDQSTMLFRIVQEAFTNIARYANATRVKTSLNQENALLILSVTDNGKGIKKEEISSPTSFGIIGIQERVNFLKGSVKIEGVEGEGTTIVVTVPLSDKA